MEFTHFATLHKSLRLPAPLVNACVSEVVDTLNHAWHTVSWLSDTSIIITNISLFFKHVDWFIPSFPFLTHRKLRSFIRGGLWTTGFLSAFPLTDCCLSLLALNSYLQFLLHHFSESSCIFYLPLSIFPQQ